MTVNEWKNIILGEIQKREIGDMIPNGFWSKMLAGIDGENRERFESAKRELIKEGYLQDHPVKQSANPLGTLTHGLWIVMK